MASADLTARYTPDHPAAFATPPAPGSQPERIPAHRIEDGTPVEVHRLGGMEMDARAALFARLVQLPPTAASRIVEIAPDGTVVVTHPLGAPDLAAWLETQPPTDESASAPPAPPPAVPPAQPGRFTSAGPAPAGDFTAMFAAPEAPAAAPSPPPPAADADGAEPRVIKVRLGSSGAMPRDPDARESASSEPDTPADEPSPAEETIAIGFTGTIGPTIQRPAGGVTGQPPAPGPSHPIMPPGVSGGSSLPPVGAPQGARAAIPLPGAPDVPGAPAHGPIVQPGAPIRGAWPIAPDAETPPRGVRLPESAERNTAPPASASFTQVIRGVRAGSPNAPDQPSSAPPATGTPGPSMKPVFIALAVLAVVAVVVVLLVVLVLLT